MDHEPEPTGVSLYTLRRRIPIRATDAHDAPRDRGAGVQKPEQFEHAVASPITRLNALIVRLFPTVRLGH